MTKWADGRTGARAAVGRPGARWRHKSASRSAPLIACWPSSAALAPSRLAHGIVRAGGEPTTSSKSTSLAPGSAVTVPPSSHVRRGGEHREVRPVSDCAEDPLPSDGEQNQTQEEPESLEPESFGLGPHSGQSRNTGANEQSTCARSAQEDWDFARQRIKNVLPANVFQTWVAPVETVLKLDEEEIVVKAPSDFIAAGLVSQCGPPLESALQTVLGHDVKLRAGAP